MQKTNWTLANWYKSAKDNDVNFPDISEEVLEVTAKMFLDKGVFSKTLDDEMEIFKYWDPHDVRPGPGWVGVFSNKRETLLNLIMCNDIDLNRRSAPCVKEEVSKVSKIEAGRYRVFVNVAADLNLRLVQYYGVLKATYAESGLRYAKEDLRLHLPEHVQHLKSLLEQGYVIGDGDISTADLRFKRHRWRAYDRISVLLGGKPFPYLHYLTDLPIAFVDDDGNVVEDTVSMNGSGVMVTTNGHDITEYLILYDYLKHRYPKNWKDLTTDIYFVTGGDDHIFAFPKWFDFDGFTEFALNHHGVEWSFNIRNSYLELDTMGASFVEDNGLIQPYWNLEKTLVRLTYTSQKESTFDYLDRWVLAASYLRYHPMFFEYIATFKMIVAYHGGLWDYWFSRLKQACRKYKQREGFIEMTKRKNQKLAKANKGGSGAQAIQKKNKRGLASASKNLRPMAKGVSLARREEFMQRAALESYIAARCNPFSMEAVGARNPAGDGTPTLPIRTFLRVPVTLTGGTGMAIRVIPAFTNDQASLQIGKLVNADSTFSSMANNVYHTALGSPFSNDALGNNVLETRLISFGIKVKNTGPPLYQQGVMIGYSIPSYGIVLNSGLSPNSYISNENARLRGMSERGSLDLVYAFDDVNASVYWFSSAFAEDQNGAKAFVYVPPDTLGNVNVEIEFVSHWECRGVRVTHIGTPNAGLSNYTQIVSAVGSALRSGATTLGVGTGLAALALRSIPTPVAIALGARRPLA